MNGGGILANWGVYDLDYLLGLFDWTLRPSSVTAQVWPIGPRFSDRLPKESDGEAHAAAFIRCAEGPTILFERAEAVPGQAEQAWQIVGDHGTLHLTMVPGDQKTLVWDDATDAHGIRSTTLWEGDEDHTTPHHGPVDDFAKAILEGRPPLTDLHQALVIQQITDAIYESSESGSTVSLTT